MNRDIRWTPFWVLLRREVHRFLKVIVQTVITPFMSSALYLMIFGVSLGRQIAELDGVPYLAFLIPGLVMMSCLNNAFQNSASSVISSKFSGDLEDLKAAPFSPSQIIFALSLAALARGLIVGAVTLLVGELSYYAIYERFLTATHPTALIVFLAIGGMVFANIGIVTAFWARSFDQMSAISGFVLTPLIYLGGVFFSVDHLPGFWRSIAMYNPLLYMINGVRYGLLGRADVDPKVAFAISALAFVFTLLLARSSLKRGSFQRW